MHKSKKIISLFLLVLMILIQVIPYGLVTSVYADVGADIASHLSLSVDTDGKAVLGKSENVSITITNNNTSDWVYNLSIEATLDSGLSINSNPSSAMTVQQADKAINTNPADPAERAQVVSWKDIKDLAPHEVYTFSFTVDVNENYRQIGTGNPGQDVNFGDILEAGVRIYGGNIPQDLITSGLEVTKSCTTKVYPFEVVFSGGGKLPKGAGTTEDSNDDRWTADNTITIVNNNKYRSEIDFTSLIPNGMEVSQFSALYTAVTGAKTDTAGADFGKTNVAWNTISVDPQKTVTINYKCAIFNNYYTTAGGVNTGAVILDGTALTTALDYKGKVYVDQTIKDGFDGTLSSTRIAKDIVVYKSVSPDGNVGYGDGLTYTIKVQANQYYSVPNVTVTDELGEDPVLGTGQEFLAGQYSGVGYSILPNSYQPQFNSNIDQLTGKTTLKWDMGTVANEVVGDSDVVINFKTQVLQKWSKTNADIVANDTIRNLVNIQGDNVNVQGAKVADADSTSVGIAMPSIEIKAIALNGGSIDSDNFIHITVGDKVKFRLTYKGTNLNVKQKNVGIDDYLPIGMTLVGGTVAYTSGTALWDASTKGFSQTDSNASVLKWSWNLINENPGDLVVEYEAVVNNVPEVVIGKMDYNMAKLSLKNNWDTVNSFRSEVKVEYTEPVLKITKTSAGNSKLMDVVGSANIPFEIKVENKGTGAAYNVSIKDTLPDELESPVYVSAVDGEGHAVITGISSGNSKNIQFEIIDCINPGKTVTIQYRVSTVNAPGNLRQFANKAVISSYYSGVNSAGRHYTFTDESSVNFTIKAPAIEKTVEAKQNDNGAVRVGDWIIYKIKADIPDHTQAYNASILENIPDNQSLQGVYSSYDGSTLSGIIPTLNAADTPDTNDFRFALTTPLTSGTYYYYVKTTVTGITSGNSETQTNKAVLEWKDAANDRSPISHNSNESAISVDVQKPQLDIKLTSTKTLLAKNDSAVFTVTIDNIGVNTAYSFIPTVNIAPDYSASDLPEEASFINSVVTFPKVDSLTPEAAPLIYTFTVKLDVLKGAGSSSQFIAHSGNYYTLPEAGEMLTSVQSQVNIAVPAVTIQKTIQSTTSGDISNICPGDEVTYAVVVTVPAGTIAYQTAISDTLPNDLVRVSGDALIREPETINASDEAKIITINFAARARTDVAYNEASDNIKPESNQAAVTWNKQDNSDPMQAQSSVSVNVKTPRLSIGTISKDATTLGDSQTSIKITFPVENTGASTAYNVICKAVLPLELENTLSISDGGTYDSNARTITWLGLQIAAAQTKDMSFYVKLKSDGTTGSNRKGLPVNILIDQYQTRQDTEYKAYTQDITASTNIDVAPPVLTKVVTVPGNGQVRPGDSVEYEIKIIIPQNTTAYALKLTETPDAKENLGSVTDITGGVGDVLGSGQDVRGGTYRYKVMTTVKTDASYNLFQYTSKNTAIISWADKAAGATGITTNGLSFYAIINVTQPHMTISSSATKPIMALLTDIGTHTVTVTNNGNNIAYNIGVEVAIPTELSIVPASISDDGSYDPATRKITWNLSQLNNSNSKNLTFNYTTDNSAVVGHTVQIQSKITSYSSFSGAGAKTYAQITSNASVIISGNHALVANSPDINSLQVLNEGKFQYTLSNLGPTADSYIISHTAHYKAVLYDTDGSTVLARDDDGNGSFEVAVGGFNLGNGFNVDKNGSIVFYIGFTPPITEPKGHAEAFKVFAISKGTSNSKDAANKITITGRALEGVTQPADDANWENDWSEATKASGQKLVLTALTSNDITTVKVMLRSLDDHGQAAGYAGNTDTMPILLTELTNGRFKYEYTIPNNFSNGEYIAEYYSYNNGDIQDHDKYGDVAAPNNRFIVKEPSLSIQMTPGGSTVTGGEQITYTVKIKNELAGGTTAFNFAPTVIIPQGVTLVTAGLIDYAYNAQTRTLTFLNPAAGGPSYDLDYQAELTKSFTVNVADDLSADESMTITASTGEYNSSDDNGGKFYTAKTSSVTLSTGTVQFSSKVLGTYDGSGKLTSMEGDLYDKTNNNDSFLRPGDQVIYDLFIDIPEGLHVKDVKVKDEVVNDLTLNVEKLIVDGHEYPVNDPGKGEFNFSGLAQDTHIYVCARVRTDMPIGAFTAKSQSTVEWSANYRSYTGQIAADVIPVDGKQPELNISFNSSSTNFDQPGKLINFTGSVCNNGNNTAYNTKLVVEVPDGFEAEDGTITNGGVLNAHTITWSLPPLSSTGTKDIFFRLKLSNNTTNNLAGAVVFKIDEYYSAPHAMAKKYPAISKNINLTVAGGQGLTGSDDKSVKAGEGMIFEHTLSNTGGGKDDFELSINNGTGDRVKLKLENTMLAEDSNGDGVWDTINDQYKSGGKLVLPLNAGESAVINIEDSTPESAPKGRVGVITLTAKGQLLNQAVNVLDTLRIIGEPINGWTGNPYFLNDKLPDSSSGVTDKLRTDWKKPNLVPGSPLKLEAITSSDIESVEAVIKNQNGGVFGNSITLEICNEAVDVAKGYALWEKNNFVLPTDIPAGTYFVEFKAYSGNILLESDATTTVISSQPGYNNYFAVLDKIDSAGKITGRGLDGTTPNLPGSIVKLYDTSGKKIAETIADLNGDYSFTGVLPIDYRLVVENNQYKNAEKQIDILAIVDNGIARVDVELIQFTLDLKANPSTIVGDGISKSELTATVLDSQKKPLKNVTVTFDAPIGSFPDGKTVLTDINGIAKVMYQSEKIEGLISQVIPITARVDHWEGNLHMYDTEQIFITFEPAYISGRVVDSRYEKDEKGDIKKDGNGVPIIKSEPVAGAVVEVFKDFNNDGINDFYSRFVTGADGKYKIGIPKGSMEYDIRITKTLIIDEKNNKTTPVTFEQKAEAGAISGAASEEFAAQKTLVGLIISKDEQGNKKVYDNTNGYQNDQGQSVALETVVRDANGVVLPGVTGTIDSNGGFLVQNIPANNSTFLVDIVYPLPGGEKITIGTAKIAVSTNGDLSIGEALIDPYGTVTDENTGAIIAGAQVSLYYGSNGNANDNTLVPLPKILGFAPNDNINPQNSDTQGKYAFMVFPNTKYYILSTKPGYNDYDSRTKPEQDGTADGFITVGSVIVKYDIAMKKTPTQQSGGKGGGGNIATPDLNAGKNLDPAITISSDKAIYQEGDTALFTLKYYNKLSADIDNVSIQLGIPAGLTVMDTQGGLINNNTINWNIGKLKGNGKGQITLKAKAQSINTAEIKLAFSAKISSTGNLINPEDDQSSLSVMVFSNRFVPQSHLRYIKGYPDKNFKPLREITRGEIAAIFARIMELKSTVEHKKIYSDVPQSHWAAEYIEAVTKAGLFIGEAGKTFGPDRAISRAELCVVISRYLKLKDVKPQELHFKDINGHWALNAIEEIYRYKIISGYPDGRFSPDKNLTRVETVVMINHLLYRGPITNITPSFPDIEKYYWGLGHIEESTRTHEYTRNPDGSELMTKDNSEQLW